MKTDNVLMAVKLKPNFLQNYNNNQSFYICFFSLSPPWGLKHLFYLYFNHQRVMLLVHVEFFKSGQPVTPGQWVHYYCSSLTIVVCLFSLQEEKIDLLKRNPHISGPAQPILMFTGQLYSERNWDVRESLTSLPAPPSHLLETRTYQGLFCFPLLFCILGNLP